MELITILNRCYRHRGFVYQNARFGPDKKSIEVDVRARERSVMVCSGCHKPAPGYDHLPDEADHTATACEAITSICRR
jgi:transposase